MKIFISAGEPSGDMHAANLMTEIRRRKPDVTFSGLGGDHMKAAGCDLLYPMCQLAVMLIWRVLAKMPLFLSILSKVDRSFRHHRPDAVILIDFPGFNWWVARRAHLHGVPVFWFVPPQLWAWAGWRVRRMQRWVDHVLCTLPFEENWYAERNVQAHFVGHPYFDELHERVLDQDFLQQQRQQGGRIVAILPGSRTMEVERNFTSMRRAMEQLSRRHEDVRFLVACFKQAHRDRIDAELDGRGLPVRTFVGQTPEIIEAAHCCVSVSGSVSLELLFHNKPTAIIYRLSRLEVGIKKLVLNVPYITLVNLLADEELFPEFVTNSCPSEGITSRIDEWLTNTEKHQALCDKLSALRAKVAKTGACRTAANFVVDALTKEREQKIAA